MKFGQSIEHNKRKFFFRNHAQNEAKKLVPDFFLFFKKVLKGETKLICWSTGPTNPILNKSKKNNIATFWPTGFFFNLLISAF